MKKHCLIGCDISKNTIDLFACPQTKSLKIKNNHEGFKQLQHWIAQLKIPAADLTLIMEHTGLYSYQFEAWLHAQGIAFTKVSGLAVKRSLGMIRGKNDAIDAARLARFGLEKADLLNAQPVPDAQLEELRQLCQLREELVATRTAYLNSYQQLEHCLRDDACALNLSARQRLIDVCSEQIQAAEAQIEALRASHEPIAHSCRLLQSIVGVGPVLSTAMIIATANFTRFPNARSFACYCGTAPFEHSSGTSIRGKTRTSTMADKRIKTLLFLAASSAIRSDAELRAYYERRVAEGKHKRSVLNIIMNKLIWRMFAVIKHDRFFERDAQKYKAAKQNLVTSKP